MINWNWIIAVLSGFLFAYLNNWNVFQMLIFISVFAVFLTLDSIRQMMMSDRLNNLIERFRRNVA